MKLTINLHQYHVINEHDMIASSPILLQTCVSWRPHDFISLSKSATVLCLAFSTAITCKSRRLVKLAPQFGRSGLGAILELEEFDPEIATALS